MTDQKLRSGTLLTLLRVLGDEGGEDAQSNHFPHAKRPQYLVAHLLRSFGGGYYVK